MSVSVFLADFPVADESFADEELRQRWRLLLGLRDEVNKALEIKRAEKFIGNSLEARIGLVLPEQLLSLCRQYGDFLPAFFLVSGIDLIENAPEQAYASATIEGLKVSVEKASGGKCQRCWNWSESVGSHSKEPELCERCYRVITL